MTPSLLPALLISTAVLGGSPRGVVLDFSAQWCGPCQQMSPIVARLERQGYSIRKVDVDQERELADKYNVSSIPTFVLVVDGKEVMRRSGAMSEEQLRRMLSQIPSDPQPVAASTPADSRPDWSSSGESFTDRGEPSHQPDSSPRPTTPPVAAAVETNAEPQDKPSLWSKLLGRNEEPEPPQQPSVVRGNDPTPQPEKLLPVRDPAAASVRLHVTINGQTSVGSGTAIDSRPGRTVVTTCGHLFKGWNEQSKIEVDVFTDAGMQQYVGRMINYDVTADVGIVTIPTDTIIATAEVPDVDGRLSKDEAAVNIGCSGGQPPTEELVQVTALNYFEGPDNVECTGVPVQGRSGGGLFNRDGQLVGVCIGADAQRQRGAYAGLLAIHDLLDAAGLTELYRPQTAPATSQSAPVAQTESNGFDSFAGGEPAPAAAPTGTPPQQTESAGLAEAQAMMAGGNAEVICIIRDRRQPEAPSRVVIIDRASPKFLNYLGSELTETSLPAAQNSTQTDRRVPPAVPPVSRQPASRQPVSRDVTEPSSEFRSSATSRPLFTRPGDSQTGPQPRNESLQPTALAGPFVPQRYIRSEATRR